MSRKKRMYKVRVKKADGRRVDFLTRAKSPDAAANQQRGTGRVLWVRASS